MSSKPDSKKQNTNMKAAPNLIEEIDLPDKSNENNVHQDLNPFTEIKQASHKLGFKNQTQFIPNSTDKNPFHDKNISGLFNILIARLKESVERVDLSRIDNALAAEAHLLDNRSLG